MSKQILFSNLACSSAFLQRSSGTFVAFVESLRAADRYWQYVGRALIELLFAACNMSI